MQASEEQIRIRLPSGINVILVVTLVLSVVSLILEESGVRNPAALAAVQVVDFTVLALLYAEIVWEALQSASLRLYLRRNAFNLGFMLVFTALFVYNKAVYFSGSLARYGAIPGAIVVLRNLFILFKVFGRIRKLTLFVRSITAQPARTVMLSFVLVIITGTILLMLPLASAQERIGFVDALFTATSAVCVTGLIVVDTATAFSFWGKLFVLALIQIGGLGIMILSFFVAFAFRRSLSLEDKFLISYMLSERDMSSLGHSVRRIIYITLIVEGVGAALLFAGFAPQLGLGLTNVFAAVFHAVSAFCNAGFSVFSDSLERFRGSVPVNLVVALLIVTGGISFAVVLNVRDTLRTRLSSTGFQRHSAARNLNLNTRVVLLGTLILLVSGTFLFYGLEHRSTLLPYGVGTQYLASFFQSVTLRTAGFNTVPTGGLRTPTYLFMIVFMFIGAASGSTAGGIKINSLAIILAYVRSILLDQPNVTLFRYSVAKDLVLRALLIFLFGIFAVLLGVLLLSATEQAPFIVVFFEAVSAFGTVGLSAGITPHLTVTGKCVIIVLMFIGRLGPLTLLAAAVRRVQRVHAEYPRGEVMIG